MIIHCQCTRRSRSYRGSSADSDGVLHSPVGLQHLNYTFNDVFPESGDCNAALCPIHQGLGMCLCLRCCYEGTFSLPTFVT